MKRFIVASASPRRRELLENIGFRFEIIPSDADESCEEKLSPEELVKELAKRKAESVFRKNTDSVVLGCDTVVEYGGTVLGKPSDRKEAAKMLRLLSGKVHNVHTGVYIVDKEKTVSFINTVRVEFYELSDELIFEPARWLSLTVNGQSLPVGGRNLIIRAANALNEAVGERHGARIQLKKHIPIRAGLGGGSADCAVTLLTLNQLWGLHLPMERLLAIGRTLGADVPFCMLGGLARVGGVGEKLSPIPGAPSIPLAMVTPGGGLSTPAVFKAWDEGSYPIVPVDMPALSDALIRGDLDAAQSLS